MHSCRHRCFVEWNNTTEPIELRSEEPRKKSHQPENQCNRLQNVFAFDVWKRVASITKETAAGWRARPVLCSRAKSIKIFAMLVIIINYVQRCNEFNESQWEAILAVLLIKSHIYAQPSAHKKSTRKDKTMTQYTIRDHLWWVSLSIKYTIVSHVEWSIYVSMIKVQWCT